MCRSKAEGARRCDGAKRAPVLPAMTTSDGPSGLGSSGGSSSLGSSGLRVVAGQQYSEIHGYSWTIFLML